MEDYIKQLLEDIRAAHQSEEPEDSALQMLPGETEEEYQMRQLEEHFAEVERFVSEEPPHNLSYYCDLKPDQFPPEDLLSDAQVAAITESFTAMLFSWNISADIPESVPERKAYPLLISLLQEHFFMSNAGISHWSFCACEPDECVLGEYCTCKDLECQRDLKLENEGKDGRM